MGRMKHDVGFGDHEDLVWAPMSNIAIKDGSRDAVVRNRRGTRYPEGYPLTGGLLVNRRGTR